MVKFLKPRLASWIMSLRIVQWAHRVEGERRRRELYAIFGQLDEYELIRAEERSGASARM